jgi:hypothetical protein
MTLLKDGPVERLVADFQSGKLGEAFGAEILGLGVAHHVVGEPGRADTAVLAHHRGLVNSAISCR